MRVLILGGTGAIGMHLVQLLSNNGIDTFVTTRKKRESVEKIQYIQGDAHDIVFLQGTLKEHYDAIVDFMVYTTLTFKERIGLLLDASKQYIFLSSARVYANSKQPINESSPRLLNVSADEDFLKTEEYSLAKARQEDILKKSGRKNWTIIRPYITYSENRLQLGILEKEEWLYRALHGRTIVFSKDIISKTTTLTYGLDVSRGIMSIIANQSVMGETFHITANESITWTEVLSIYMEILEKHLGRKSKIMLQELDMFIDFRPGISKYQILYDRLFDRTFDNSKITQYIHMNFFYSPELGLKKCFESFLKNPQFLDLNWKLEALKDKRTGERTSLKEISSIKNKLKYLLYRCF